MGNDIMKYLHFDTRMLERRIINVLKNKVRTLIKSGKWNLNVTGIVDYYRGNDAADTRAIVFDFQGKRMLAVFVFFNKADSFYWDIDNRLIEISNSTVFLFSDNYVYASRKVPAEWLWDMKITPTREQFENLLKYDEVNQKTGLGDYVIRNILYLEGKKSRKPQELNYLLLLFAQYNKGLELLVKAGLFFVARYLMICDNGEDTVLNADPDSFHNLKEWLGVTNRVLVKLNEMLSCCEEFEELEDKGWWFVTGCSVMPRNPLTDREFFARLSDIQNYNPEYLNMDRFTPAILRFFMENHFTHRRPSNDAYQIRRRITGISCMKDRHILTIVRFLETLDEDMVDSYMRYLHASGKCVYTEDYPYGLQPKDVERAAFIAEYGFNGYRNLNKEIIRDFRRMTSKIEYKCYATDKHAEHERGEAYFISVPKAPSDLYKEAKFLGHCVFSNCESVAKGKTRIFLMRKVDSPEKPFVTLEVTLDNRLIQAKAYNDMPAPENAQRYLLKWAREKNIEPDTPDLTLCA